MYINPEAHRKGHVRSKMGGGYYILHANLQKLCSPSAALSEREKKVLKRRGSEEKHHSVPGKAEAGERRPRNDMQHDAMTEWKLRKKVAAAGVLPGGN